VTIRVSVRLRVKLSIEIAFLFGRESDAGGLSISEKVADRREARRALEGA
jgi:hypothetical protein